MHATKSAENLYVELEADFDGMVGNIIKISGNAYGNFYELKADCSIYFMEALQKYDPKRGPVENWLRYKVKKELREHRRKTIRRDNIVQIKYMDMTSPVIERTATYSEKQTFIEFKDELSADASYIVDLILGEVGTLPDFTIKNGHRNGKTGIRKYLKKLNWETSNIDNALNEIYNAWSATYEN